MVDSKSLIVFIESVYSENPRGLIHGTEHSVRLVRDAEILGKAYKCKYDEDVLRVAGLLHGAIHYCEHEIKEWLKEKMLSDEAVDRIITVAWESQTKEIPLSLEGKLLHDAHFLEGGKEFHILKPFIVGTEMGQPIEATIAFIKKSMLTEPIWYLPESKDIFEEIIHFTREFIDNLEKRLYMK